MASKNPSFGQQPDLLLSRIFTGHPVGSPAMGTALLNAAVVQPTTDQGGRPAVIVQVGGFGQTSATDGTTASFTCSYEPRFGSGSTALVPPPRTPCLVAFMTNSGASQGINPGASGLVVAFLGWPT